MDSIRNRLMLVLAIGFVAVIAAAGFAAEQLLVSSLTRQFDEGLIATARTLGTLTEQEAGEIEFDFRGEFMPEFGRERRPQYFQLRLPDGTTVARSARLEGDLVLPAPGPGVTAVGNTRLPDGRPGRAVRMEFTPRGPGDDEDATRPPAPPADAKRVVLVVARDRLDLDGRIARLRLTIVGGGALAALLGAFLVWRALVSGFRPLGVIAAQVEALDAESLGTRIALAGRPRELAPIVDQLNAMLVRLEASFRRERRFAGNVAHELRTPIAELRTLAEVGERWPEDAAAASAFFRDAGAIARRMERLVSGLLLLARCQAGVEPVARRPVSPRALLEEAWHRRTGNGPAGGRMLGLDVAAALEVESDPDKLAIVLENLLDNALSHSPAGSEIRCDARITGGRWRLRVSNAAAPLEAEDLANLTAPFWRKDEARTSEEHSGLGLSLVAALAELLGLELSFRQGPDGRFEAQLDGDADRPG